MAKDRGLTVDEMVNELIINPLQQSRKEKDGWFANIAVQSSRMLIYEHMNKVHPKALTVDR